MRIGCWLGIMLLGGLSPCRDCLADEHRTLADALLFHASFDESTTADFATGDARIFTAPSLKRESARAGLHVQEVVRQGNQGRYGGCLSFLEKTEELVFYRGGANVPYSKSGFGGTISFWMRLSPDDDLPPGYVDPLQITDKKWNDASLFVDFTEKNPRQFRLGVFADYKFWNPRERPWDDIPAAERPLVTVSKPPFARDRWTHVAITYSGFNSDDEVADAVLYLDGQPQGHIRGRQRFTWNAQEVAIMLGIAYVGRLDDLALFSRSLTKAEIGQLLGLPNGINSLRKPR